MSSTYASSTNTAKILIACQQLEMTCAAIYRQFADKCGEDGESRSFFTDLVRDEEEHGGRFELLFKIMEYSQIDCSVDFYHISNVLRSMEGALSQITASRQLPLKEMLRIAAKSEERLLGLHAELVADVVNPSWKNYFHELNRADIMHMEKIREFQKRRG